MTRWCLIVALVLAAPGCQRQVLSDEQWARSVGISPAPAANLPEQLPDLGGAEFKDRPDDNPQSSILLRPREARRITCGRRAKYPHRSQFRQSHRTMKSRSRQPWPPQSHGRHRRRRTSPPLRRRGPPEMVRNSSPTVTRRDPAPATTDPVHTLSSEVMQCWRCTTLVLRDCCTNARRKQEIHGPQRSREDVDPNYLRREGAVGLQSNRSEAISLYQKAAALGDPEAEVLLRQLQN